jgi:gluconolactonase
MSGFTLLASGYGAIEGPMTDDAGALYFSDVFNGGVFRLTPDGKIDLVVPKRRFVGGIIAHRDGGIVIAGRDISRVHDGNTEVLLARDDVPSTGFEIGGFNDMCADDAGRIFSGLVRRDADGEAVDGELIVISERGKAITINRGLGLPNGAATSPDGRWLYHADTTARSLAVFDLGDRTGLPILVRQISTAAVEGGPDGIAVDIEGGIWMALHEGGCIARFTPDGDLDRRVEVPARDPLNVCFIGPDLEDLVVVTLDNAQDPALAASVFRTNVGVRGLRAGRVAL